MSVIAQEGEQIAGENDQPKTFIGGQQLLIDFPFLVGMGGYYCFPPQFVPTLCSHRFSFQHSLLASYSQKCTFPLPRTNTQSRDAPSPSVYPLGAGFSSFWKVTAPASQGRWGYALCSSDATLCPDFSQ